MGVSTDAKLVYGVPIEDDYVQQYDEDADTVIDAESEGVIVLSRMAYYDTVIDEVGLETHCSDECTMYIATPETAPNVTAHRGYPELVDPTALKVDPDWAPMLASFCEKYGAKITGPAGWYLVSYWG